MRLWPLTPRGTGAVVLAVVFFFLAHTFRITEMLYISVLLLVAVGASLATLYLVRRTAAVARAFHPDVVSVGEDAGVRVRIDVRSPLPASAARWADALPDGVRGPSAGVLPPLTSSLGTGAQRIEVDYVVHTDKRGARAVGPLAITAADPFGFARRRQVLGEAHILTVAPAIVELPALDDLPGSSGGSMHSETNELGQGADNLIPRPYMPGDSMRRIHWRASAHRDDLMVRQEEQESTPEAVVVFDRTAGRYGNGALLRPGENDGFEAAVSAAASAIARLVAEGYIVTVIDVDGAEIVERIEGGDRAGIDEMTVAFATLTSRREGSLADLVRLFAGAVSGPVVIVTGRFDESDAETLAPLVHHSSLPVLLTVAPRGQALRFATESGWRTASIEVGHDLTDAWTTALVPEVGRVVA